MSGTYSDEDCGHCLNHKKEQGAWICVNPDSECYGCYTEYRDTCDLFEERRPQSRFSVEIQHKKY